MLFHINNSLISPCFAVLKTDTHNYLCPACLLDAKVIPRNPSHICLIQELYLSTKYTFKIFLNFIFILNPNIAFWQFPPVKYIITKVWPNPPSCRLGGGGGGVFKLCMALQTLYSQSMSIQQKSGRPHALHHRFFWDPETQHSTGRSI